MTNLRNLGHHERIIRVGLGITLLAIGGFSIGPEWSDLLLLGIGFIALLTGIVGYCPAWHLMGISTCQRKDDTHHSEPDQAPSKPSSH